MIDPYDPRSSLLLCHQCTAMKEESYKIEHTNSCCNKFTTSTTTSTLLFKLYYGMLAASLFMFPRKLFVHAPRQIIVPNNFGWHEPSAKRAPQTATRTGSDFDICTT